MGRKRGGFWGEGAEEGGGGGERGGWWLRVSVNEEGIVGWWRDGLAGRVSRAVGRMKGKLCERSVLQVRKMLEIESVTDAWLAGERACLSGLSAIRYLCRIRGLWDERMVVWKFDMSTLAGYGISRT